jgi:ankyrin repeat protein
MTNMPAMKHPDPAMQPDAGLDCNPLDDVDFSAFLRTSCNTTPVAASKSPVAGGRGIDILYWDKTNYKVMHNLPWFAFQGLITKHIITTSASLPLAPFLHCSSAPGENRKAMFRLVRTDSSFHELEVVKTLSSMVELLPERYDGENSMKLNQLLDPSIQNSNMEAEEIALYLMANNMIKYEAMNRFLEYVTGQKSKEHFRPLFEMKTPTVEAISVRLLEAVATCGAESMLQSLLDAGIDRCHLSGSRGGRLLQIAAYHEVKSVAESLIQSGADVNPNLDSTQVFDLNGAWKWDLATPLENAAFRGNAEMVKLLLEAGAKVDRGSSSQYALALAIRGEKADCIAMLLKAGAKVDDCEVGNMRALDFAFATKKTDIYRMLLASKQPGKIFVTVNGLLLEARRGVSALRRYLKRGGYSDKRNEREALEMALISAVDNVNFSKAIRPLLAFGVNPNTPTAKKEFCPLETAVQNNDIETVELLLGAHADITSDVLACAVDGEDKLDILNFLFESRAADIEYHGPDALSYAIIAENLQAIKLLLRLGVDLDESDDEYFFPIQRAACRGNLEILECIFGASRDSYAPRNRTKHFIALHYAAEEGNLECLRFLLLHGAHINQLQQYRGMTLLQVCAAGAGGDYNFSSDRAEIFKLLLKSGAGINGPNPRKRSRTWNSALTYLLIYSAPEELVQLALEAGADINQAGRGDGARTPLQAAAEVENLGMVKELLRRGADINARSANKNGRTALQAVCMAEYPRLELFEFLLANGADVNAPAGIDGGVTALQGAAMMCHFKIVFRLIECGADVNAEPAIREGRMALDGAAEHGRQDMVQLILNAGAKSERPGETGYDRAIELAERNGHFYMRGLFESYKQTTAAV